MYRRLYCRKIFVEIFAALIIIICLYGCNRTKPEVPISNVVNTPINGDIREILDPDVAQTPESTEMETFEPSADLKVKYKYLSRDVFVVNVLDYLSENGEYAEYAYLLNNICIYDNYINDELVYFVEIQLGYQWSVELYQIYEKDGEILNMKYTGAGGDKRFFEYELIKITQGNFIAAYDASSQGNGNLLLIPLDNLGEVKYSFHTMGYRNPTEYGYGFKDNEEGTEPYGVIYDRKLKAEYRDINNDGNTDVILTGTQGVYDSNYDESDLLLREDYVTEVYLYDPDIDDFVLSDELSQQVLINEY
jgi:hypothetical protein